MRRVTMLVGPPGVGKSTIVRAVLERLGRPELTRVKWVPHHRATMVGSPDRTEVVVLGDYSEPAHLQKFPGTDRLSMAVAPHALEFAVSDPADHLVLEGARLGTPSFIRALLEAGLRVRIGLVTVETAVLKHRQEFERGDQRVSFQEGQATKVNNLVGLFPQSVVLLRSRDQSDLEAAVDWVLR